MQKILFVCSSNFSRSPLAAAMMRRKLHEEHAAERYLVDSAGAFPGVASRGAERKTMQLAAEHGLDLSSHRTRECLAEDVRTFDRIIVLDDDSYVQVNRLAAEAGKSGSIKRFVDYFGDLSLLNVADAVLGEIGYDEMYRILNQGVEHLYRSLKNQEPTNTGP